MHIEKIFFYQFTIYNLNLQFYNLILKFCQIEK
jgi:hypothetical protein